MGHILLDSSFSHHPSFLELPDRGAWAWVSSICWLSQNGRRTAFPKGHAKQFGATPKIKDALVENGLWIDHGPIIAAPQMVTCRWSGREKQLWKFGPNEARRPPIHPLLRAAVYERDGHACRHCGSTDNLSIDHIHPFSLGGQDTFENFQTLCRSCNSKKGARI